MTMSIKENNQLPDWLKELQIKSWNPEILLSGMVIFGMFRLPKYLQELEQYFWLNLFTFEDADILFAVVRVGVYWLIFGLSLHLIIRAFWVGLIGLSSIYPEGFKFQNLKYHQVFQEKLERIPDIHHIIIRLDKISSAIFSISILLFMSLIVSYFYYSLLIITPLFFLQIMPQSSLSSTLGAIFPFWNISVLIIGILSIIDFVTLGFFKRFRILSKVYSPLHSIISRLTFSKLYRPIYYVFVSNLKRWKVSLLLITFTIISLFLIAWTADSKYAHEKFSLIKDWSAELGHDAISGYYDDQNKGRRDRVSGIAHIQSDIIEGDVIRLFVSANAYYNYAFEENTPTDSLESVYPDATDAFIKRLKVASFFQVFIDDQVIEIEKWQFHYKTHLGQMGYLTYLDVSQLESGNHAIKITGPDHLPDFILAIITFYKVP